MVPLWTSQTAKFPRCCLPLKPSIWISMEQSTSCCAMYRNVRFSSLKAYTGCGALFLNKCSPPLVHFTVWSPCWVIHRGHKSPNSLRLSAPINQVGKTQIISDKMNISWWHCFMTALILRQLSQSGLIPFSPKLDSSWIDYSQRIELPKYT